MFFLMILVENLRLSFTPCVNNTADYIYWWVSLSLSLLMADHGFKIITFPVIPAIFWNMSIFPPRLESQMAICIVAF